MDFKLDLKDINLEDPEELGIFMLELRNRFYYEFSNAVARTLQDLPLSVHSDQLAMVQDMCSAYGSRYSEYVNGDPDPIPEGFELIETTGPEYVDHKHGVAYVRPKH